MSLQELHERYLTVPQIMEATGQNNSTVHNWLKYHRYMSFEYAFETPIVRIEDFERFKAEHPELVNKPEISQ